MSRIIPFTAPIELPDQLACSMEEVVKTLEIVTIDALKRPGSFVESLRGINLYASTFPKVCNSCKEVYQDRDDYLSRTAALNPKHVASGTIEDQGRIIEYRNCNCGSSLVIVTPCRRDLTPFGAECRQYFDICVERFIEQAQIPPDQARGLTRIIFREVFNHCLSMQRVAHGFG